MCSGVIPGEQIVTQSLVFYIGNKSTHRPFDSGVLFAYL